MSNSSQNGSDHSNSAPYEVGRGKPPIHSRFKKGQTGNSKGRPPKKARTPKEEIQEVANQQIAVVINGKRENVSMHKAAMLALGKKAVEGHVAASKEFSRRLETCQNVMSAESINAPIDNEADKALVAEYLQHCYTPKTDQATQYATPASPSPSDTGSNQGTAGALHDDVPPPDVTPASNPSKPPALPRTSATAEPLPQPPAKPVPRNRRVCNSVWVASPSAPNETRITTQVSITPMGSFVRV